MHNKVVNLNTNRCLNIYSKRSKSLIFSDDIIIKDLIIITKYACFKSIGYRN